MPRCGCSTSRPTTSRPTPRRSKAATPSCTAPEPAPTAGERKRTVDLEGSTKSAAAAREAGIARFLQVSAIGVDDPQPDDIEPVWAAYVTAKRDADAALRESGLDWTILRPGGLTDDEPTGRVELAPKVARSSVPRADVAAVLVACLDDDRTIGSQWELVGGETPITEAIDAAVPQA